MLKFKLLSLLAIATLLSTGTASAQQDSISLFIKEYRYYLYRDQKVSEFDVELSLKDSLLLNNSDELKQMDKQISLLQSKILLSNELTRLAKESITLSNDELKYTKKQLLKWKFIGVSVGVIGLASTIYFVVH